MQALNEKASDFVLNQQLPDNEEATRQAEESLYEFEKSQLNPRSSLRSCPHLREFLPDQLDLSFFKSKDGWVLSNPVHALHLSSQIDPLWLKVVDEEPVLYGEEQERLMALQTEGVPETWHPWIREYNPSEGGTASTNTSTNTSSTAGVTGSTSSDGRQPGSLSVAKFSAQRPAKVTSSGPASTPGKLNPPSMASQQQSSSTNLSNGTATTSGSVARPSTIVSPSSQESLKFHPAPTTGSSSSSAGGISSSAAVAPSSLSASPSQGLSAPETVSSAILPGAAPSSSPLVAGSSRSAAAAGGMTTTTLVASAQSATDSTKKESSESATASLLLSSKNNSTPASTTSGSSEMIMGSVIGVLGAAATTTTSSSGIGISNSSISNANHTKNNNGLLPEDRYLALYGQEEQIRVLRRAFLFKRAAPKKKTPVVNSNNKKRKLTESKTASSTSLRHLVHWKQEHSSSSAGGQGISSSSSSSQEQQSNNNAVSTPADDRKWTEALEAARKQVQQWVFHFRLARQAFWREHHLKREQRRQNPLFARTFGAIRDDNDGDGGDMDLVESLTCVPCSSPSQPFWNFGRGDAARRGCGQGRLSGDNVMHCLDCLFVGCAPSWAVSDTAGGVSNEHMVQHLLMSNHKFAVTCGPLAKIYCFRCGEFVKQEVFEQEKERIDVGEKFPWMGWKDHSIQRSFDALRFMRVLDHGIVWSGMFATYPPLVPRYHVKAARMCIRRQNLFEGNIAELPEDASEEARDFVIQQSQKNEADRYRPPAPVGMYNLGNTCFMSAILQCLVHCVPLQNYFLREIGHNHACCPFYRPKKAPEKKLEGSANTAPRPSAAPEIVCLACELDKLFLNYFSSATGVDVTSILVQDAAASHVEAADALLSGAGPTVRGEPLVTASMLTAAWKCGEMSHLAGYEQRDAHEFLHGFLEILGNHVRQHRERVHHSINIPRPSNSIISELKGAQQGKACVLDILREGSCSQPVADAIKSIFEGTLRSVLLCGKCGGKRIQSEPFMSLSLPLSKEVQHARHGPLSVERCLQHFITPEKLTDPVVCPTCREKTPTTKQHVVSRLPKILCLHLKRFDSSNSRKIEDFVVFPIEGLNMGPYLPHWCEVTRGISVDVDTSVVLPSILYDLAGSVNHFGTLQSGHYVANVKNDSKWYHCNDAHISCAGKNGDGSTEVANGDGAYLLFYVRR